MTVVDKRLSIFLKEEYGTEIFVTKIYAILKEKYGLRSKWRKNQKREHTPQAFKPQEVVQMDTVDFGGVFAFTGVDIFSTNVDVLLALALTARLGYSFLKQPTRGRLNNFAETIQTDGEHEFKNEFKQHVLEHASRHRATHPYQKTNNHILKSFNRSLRKKCLGWEKFKDKEMPTLTQEVEQYLVYHHEKRPHISLDMRPPLTARVSHI